MRDIWRLKARSILIKCERLFPLIPNQDGVGGGEHTHIQPCLASCLLAELVGVGMGLSLSLSLSLSALECGMRNPCKTMI